MDNAQSADPPSPAPHRHARHALIGWWLLLATLAGLLPLMVALSRDFGVTWDEASRQRFGERVIRYYESDDVIDEFETDGSRFYGGLFDATAVTLQRKLPYDDYNIRHGLNAVFGWLGIVACAGLAARLAGPWAGLLAAVFAATAPRYFGHSMNNPKDVPFAAFAAWSLYALSGVRLSYPYLPLRVALGIGVAIGLSLSVRPGGLLFLAYAAGVVFIAAAANREREPRRLAATAGAFVLLVFVATTLPLPVWPWLQTRPYIGLLEAIGGVSDVSWDGSMLFNGREILASAVPWTYVPVWLVYTMPPVVLAGALLSFLRLRRGLSAGFPVLGLWFAVLFPIVYVIVRKSTIYDEIRHVLFVIPPLFVLAALGWWWLVDGLARWQRAVAVGLLGLGMVEPLVFQIRNHPNQVVYFNPLFGGPRNAIQRFELDYWGNCHYEAMRRAASLARDARMFVTISGGRFRLMSLNARRIPEVRVTGPSRRQHHLEVQLLRGRKREIVNMTHRTDTLYQVTTADGTPLCIVVPGPKYKELEKRLPPGTFSPSH
jgi:hypothetical protein